MKNTLGLLLLIAYGLAVLPAAEAQNRTMRPIPISPPGSGSVRVALTELQALRLENLSYRYQSAIQPLITEQNALFSQTCLEAGFEPDPKTCKVDLRQKWVSGNPLPPRAEQVEPEPAAGSQKKKKSKKPKESS